MRRSRNVIKSIIAHGATTGIAKRALSKHCHGFTTVFVLQRAAGVYDGIHGHDPQELEKLLIHIKRRRFKIVSLQDIVSAAQGNGDLPNLSVAFSMDGGYSDQIEVFGPIFVKHEIPLTVFLTTGLMDGELWPWDAKIYWLLQQTQKPVLKLQLEKYHKSLKLDTSEKRRICCKEIQDIYASFPGQKADQLLHLLEEQLEVKLPEIPPKEFSPASWEKVRQFEDAGITFASHTHTKRILSRLTKDQVRFELGQSLEIVKKKTRFGLPILAYPQGKPSHFGLREILLARKIGFSGAFAVSKSYSRWHESKTFFGLRYNLGRFEMPHSASDTFWLIGGTKNLYSKLGPKINCIFKKPALFVKGHNGKPAAVSLQDNDLLSVDAKRIYRLVFVCRGNISRSPYAEAFAKNIGFPAISCGVDVNYSAPAETLGSCVAFLRGMDLSDHLSRSLYDIDINEDDCLVAMDRSHLPACKDIVSRKGCQFTLIGLWRKPAIIEIDDPYGKDLETFQKCYDIIEESMKGLADFIRQRSAKGILHEEVEK